MKNVRGTVRAPMKYEPRWDLRPLWQNPLKPSLVHRCLSNAIDAPLTSAEKPAMLPES